VFRGGRWKRNRGRTVSSLAEIDHDLRGRGGTRRRPSAVGGGRAEAFSDTRAPGARDTAGRRFQLRPGVSHVQPVFDQRPGHSDNDRGDDDFDADGHDHRDFGTGGPYTGDRRLQRQTATRKQRITGRAAKRKRGKFTIVLHSLHSLTFTYTCVLLYIV